MEEQTKTGRKGLFCVFVSGTVIGVLAYVLMCRVFLNSVIVGGSMEPTLCNGERTLGLRISAENLERGSIISFYPTADDSGDLYVKRVIGLPGDTVEIRDACVYINGTELEEPYVGAWTRHTGDYEFHVPEGHVLVLGDNRDDSYDSRSWADPYVPYGNIVARTWFSYRRGDGFRMLY